MNRAERRRQEKQGIKVEKEKVYTLTQSQLKQIQIDMYKEMYTDIYKDVYNKAYQEAVDTSFGLMLSIPTNVLCVEHWKKSASKRIPKFLDDCVGLYESLADKTVEYTDILEEVEQFVGEKTYIVERLKRVREKLSNTKKSD